MTDAGFLAFADWAKRRIASPRHLVGALVVVAVWSAWAASRHFDPFSQLVINTPTTICEYLFEILILAAAIAAERKGEQVLDRLIRQHEQMLALEAHILRLEQKLAEREGVTDES